MVDDFYSAEVGRDYTNIYIKDELSVGRVEVCVNGTFSPVCQDELWNNETVAVVCSQLGYSKYGQTSPHYNYGVIFPHNIIGSFAIGGGLFSGSIANALMTHINCTGEEDNIASCETNLDSAICDDAVAVCQGMPLVLHFSWVTLMPLLF